MRKNLLFLTALLMSGMILAQRGESIMKKYENQLPQAGRGNVHVAYQGKAIDQMIYEFIVSYYSRKRIIIAYLCGETGYRDAIRFFSLPDNLI